METNGIYEYQEVLLDIYEYTSNILEKFNIKCIAHSGTLLGIVRHNQDFIPWDDDLDIMVSYKQLDDNYDEIEKEINCIDGSYHIFNFVQGEEGIKANINLLRVYSRKKIKLTIDGVEYQPFPFIDIMVACPRNTFKYNFSWKLYGRRHRMYWITRKGFNRYQRNIYDKKLTFKMNLRTYPLKLIYWTWLEDKRMKKPLNKDKGDWTVLRRVDPWSRRDISYDLDNLIKTKIRGKKIYISSNYQDELIETFGKSWETPVVSHSHIIGEQHLFHERNVQIKKYLESKYGE